MTEKLLALLALVMAIVLHEVSHGFAALALGDDTAKRQGRLTLNPIAHVDPVGTLLIPGILLLVQSFAGGHFMFGWAKPVPVAAWRFRDPRRAMMVVAAAGPAINFLLAWLTALSLHLVGDGTGAFDGMVEQFAFYFILSNLVLGLFNLLPIPPLDGGRIIVGLLPNKLAVAWARLERVGIVIVLIVVFLLPMALRDFGYNYDPVMRTLDVVLNWAWRLLPFPEGHDFDV